MRLSYPDYSIYAFPGGAYSFRKVIQPSKIWRKFGTPPSFVLAAVQIRDKGGNFDVLGNSGIGRTHIINYIPTENTHWVDAWSVTEKSDVLRSQENVRDLKAQFQRGANSLFLRSTEKEHAQLPIALARSEATWAAY